MHTGNNQLQPLSGTVFNVKCDSFAILYIMNATKFTFIYIWSVLRNKSLQLHGFAIITRDKNTFPFYQENEICLFFVDLF